MKATLRNKVTGESIPVISTTEHPDSSYGQAVWVTENGQSVAVVGMENPMFEVADMTIDDRETLGQMVRLMRVSKGVAIRALAEQCGLSKSTVVNIENGAFTPRLDIVLRILSALGATMRVSL